MKPDFKFEIQNLLSETKEGKVTGPMSPFLFAQEMSIQTGYKFNRLARVWMNDEEIHQVYEGDGLTGHDTLIIGCQYKNDLWLSLWVDTGIGGEPVAMCFQSDRELKITPYYERADYARKLTAQEIQQIFDYVFNNVHEIDIAPYRG